VCSLLRLGHGRKKVHMKSIMEVCPSRRISDGELRRTLDVGCMLIMVSTPRVFMYLEMGIIRYLCPPSQRSSHSNYVVRAAWYLHKDCAECA
jgi:hypothetical protein